MEYELDDLTCCLGFIMLEFNQQIVYKLILDLLLHY